MNFISCVGVGEVLKNVIISFVNEDSFVFALCSVRAFVSFTCSVLLAQTSATVLDVSGERSHLVSWLRLKGRPSTSHRCLAVFTLRCMHPLQHVRDGALLRVLKS